MRRDRRPRTADRGLWIVAVALSTLLIAGCVTTKPQPPQQPQILHGIASWYGEEFAGRTTANGEIFDPMQLTAAHRTLPFGTIVDVKNSKTGQTVRVRINDRGPFIGDRMIDLSYAAAQQIGLVEPGKGDVDVYVVSMGKGDREPPAPYTVTIAEPKEKVKIASGEPPKIEFPLPSEVAKSTPVTNVAADEDFKVEVQEEHAGVPTRTQVGPDGKTFVTVPLDAPAGAAPVVSAPGHSAAEALDRKESTAAAAVRSGFVVQVGAFAVEANAKALQEQLTRIGQKSYISHDVLYRVRIGPFATRDEALKARSALEANGISAMVVAQ